MLYTAVSWVIAGTLVYEIICVFGQAGRGVGSHFKVGTSFDAFVFSSMGVLIVVNMLAALVGTGVAAVGLLGGQCRRGVGGSGGVGGGDGLVADSSFRRSAAGLVDNTRPTGGSFRHGLDIQPEPRE